MVPRNKVTHRSINAPAAAVLVFTTESKLYSNTMYDTCTGYKLRVHAYYVRHRDITAVGVSSTRYRAGSILPGKR